ncbi:MAG: desulfoferrodoxin family protein [Bacteroidales bacterium]
MKRFAISVLALFCFSLVGVLANKTTVEVKAPAEVKAGTEITITITVTHKGNSKAHHTDWVYLKINGKEVQRWNYAKDSLPLTENFSIEYTYIANETLNIEAQGNCSIHGSTGPKKATVNVTK